MVRLAIHTIDSLQWAQMPSHLLTFVQGPAKAKAAKASKDSNVLQPSSTINSDQAIEDIYQKKTQLEHILLRPDTYIGSTEKQQQKMWVHDGTAIKLADIDYVPGLYKIFDEILVNAADNKVRDPKMDMLKVEINQVGFQQLSLLFRCSACLPACILFCLALPLQL